MSKATMCSLPVRYPCGSQSASRLVRILGCMLLATGSIVGQGQTQSSTLPSTIARSPVFEAAKTSQNVVAVHNSDSLRRAIVRAQPGTRIELAPGVYPGGFFFENLRGQKDRPV